MKKNDELIAKCLATTFDGQGIVKNEDYTIFVRDLLANEEAKIKIIKVKKHIAFAIVLELITKSSKRVDNFCSIGSKCGGCSYAHIAYSEQLVLKQQRVQDCFKKIAKMEDLPIQPILASPKITRYRNKVQVPTRNNLMGFYRKHSNDIVEFDDCMVQSELSNQILKTIKKLLVETKQLDVCKHILIKHAAISNEIMVVLIIRENTLKDLDKISNKLISLYPEIKSIVLNINKRQDNVILGEHEKIIYGDGYIYEQLKDLKFRISSKSFYQINSYQTENLYNMALDYAQVTNNDIVVDMYCGTGTIGIFMAQKAKKVIGIEIVEEAVKDARYNAKLNQIENIEFICEDASVAIKKIANQKIDVVVVDPPRKGLNNEGIKTIVAIEPKRIVYVSCDVATLARDVALFSSLNYQVEKIQPVDMFPYTNHVETVVLMSRVKK